MDRPRLILLAEASVDGRITLAPGVLVMFGDERWEAVAGPGSIYDELRSFYQPQACLEGSASLVTEDADPDPLPPVNDDPMELYQNYLPDSVVRRAGHRGWFTVVDGRGRVRWAYKEWPEEDWTGWHLLVLVAQGTPAEYLAYLRRETIPYLVAGDERVDLGRALQIMKKQLGVERVLSTSAGKLGGALLRAGLVDEVNVEFFPAVIGGYRTPSLFDSPELKANEWPTRLRLISAQVQVSGRVWLRYEVLS
ncbi:MAG: dihydrofolate reductase family protein [Anaerolineae bacterium]|jgi:riboflavin biosynthesis pyrimidine reductase